MTKCRKHEFCYDFCKACGHCDTEYDPKCMCTICGCNNEKMK